ncbi:hypothetical protein PybrP1_005486 [[Pythium] brassicae (nom. inval.)]|nr:hypothetical protein PybrP1_005486 [[Pythium] brassicae (nom. inval.)]
MKAPYIERMLDMHATGASSAGTGALFASDADRLSVSTPRLSSSSFVATASDLLASSLLPAPGYRDDDEDLGLLNEAERELHDKSAHRARFLSNAERVVAADPARARASFREVEAASGQREWHERPLEAILAHFNVSRDDGLSDAEAAARLAQHGPNSLEAEKRTPVYIVFLLQFMNLIIGLLMAAALASIALQEFVEGIAIIAIVTLNAVIATVQEMSASNALDALQKMTSPECVVLRGGRQMVIPSKDLVVGDIVVLTTGDVVPADIRLAFSSDLKVNEMILTGESEDVLKRYNADMTVSQKLTADNMVFSSTSVATGNATGVVIATGMGTRVGAIAALLKGGGPGAKKSSNCIKRFMEKYYPKMTPLQEALHRLGVIMGGAVIGVCVVVFVVGMVRDNADPKNPDRPVWLNMVMIAVSLAVSAVPEGLPMVVTICLSTGTADMITGAGGFIPTGDILRNGVSQAQSNSQVRASLLSAVLCSNTSLQRETDADGHVAWVPMGNSSEAPLVVAAAKAGIWREQATEAFPRVAEIPFSSARKMMITVNALPQGPSSFEGLPLPESSQFVANVKGAPNYIVKNCTQFVRPDGSIEMMHASDRLQVLEAVDALSSQALRVLAVAVRPLDKLPFAASEEDVEVKFDALCQPLVFVGLIASIDPPRQGVKDAIHKARAASIRTVMITGDYLKTAVAIAKDIDLLQVGADVEAEAVDCTVLRPHAGIYLADADVDEITSRCSVFARAKPEDKIAIVNIVEAVEKGREIYANIQRFVCFLLSTNFGEITVIFTAIAVGMPNPLEPLQILVLNLFADGMAAVALSLEKGDGTVMQERPRPRSQQIIHGRLWVLVLFNAFLIASGALIVFTTGLYWNFGKVLQSDILSGVDRHEGEEGFVNIACARWQGLNTPWTEFTNCNAKDLISNEPRFNETVRVQGALNGVVEGDGWTCYGGDYECVSDGISRAQTMAFIYITMMEMLRAYTARSFTRSVFHDMFSNKWMQWAAVGSLALTMSVTNIPVVMDDLFGFAYVEWYQWLFAYAFSVLMVIFGETMKYVYRRRDRKAQLEQRVQDGYAEMMMEIRHLRQHVERLEGKLDVDMEYLRLNSHGRRSSTSSSSDSSDKKSSPFLSFAR